MRRGTRTEHATADPESGHDPGSVPAPNRLVRTPTSAPTGLAAGLAAGLAVGMAASVLTAVPAAAVPADPPAGGAGVAAVPQPLGPVPAAGAVHADGTATDIEVRRIGLPRGAAAQAAPAPGPGTSVVAALGRRATAEFDLVGVTWRRGTAPADVEVEVRTYAPGGWSAWQELHFHPDEGPAPGEESGVTRDGTVPLWVGDADGVQARILSAEGTVPVDPDITLVDPGANSAAAATLASTGTTDGSAGSTGTAVVAAPAVLHGSADSTAASSVAVSAPRIVSRRQWGADPRLRQRCDSPVRASTVRMAFVHHTAGSNRYTRAESPAIVRSVYAYHTQGQGWCDIGYNFLVDRFGTVYEGRAGGMNTPVRGAHTGEYNTGSVGVSLMGNFETAPPTRAMRRGLVRLLGWKLASYYRDPTSRLRLAGHAFQRISGHRDAMSTACPGRYAYDWLPTLRRTVDRYVGSVETPISRRADTLHEAGAAVGVPFRGESTAPLDGRRTQFTRGWFYWKPRRGAHRVFGDYHRLHRQLGTLTGRLGYPVSDVKQVRRRRGGTQAFQGGRIYNNRRYKAAAVWGRIADRYDRLGAAGGRLGLPVHSQRRMRTGWIVHFQHGHITWNTSTGRVRTRTYG